MSKDQLTPGEAMVLDIITQRPSTIIEIAHKSGCSRATAKVYIHRLRKKGIAVKANFRGFGNLSEYTL